MYLRITDTPNGDYKYQSIEDSYKANGDRHVFRAKMHMADGKLDYAIGSLRKAKKNYDNYYRLKAFEESIPLEVRQEINRIADQVANNIINGKL